MSGQAVRRFLDFEADGSSLYDSVRERGFDCIGSIWLDPEAAAGAQHLLGEAAADLSPDRVAVFVCPECGDLGCGAVTVRIQVGSDVVTWDDWAWQTGDDPEPDRQGPEDMPTLSFDRETYEQALRADHS